MNNKTHFLDEMFVVNPICKYANNKNKYNSARNN